MKNSDKDGRKPSASFIAGAIALLFLIIGYQAALFIHKASVARVIANHDRPDTVYVTLPGDGPSSRLPHPANPEYLEVKRKTGNHSEAAVEVRKNFSKRAYESFRFNPNTVSVEDLMRLGFSKKQAESIDNYRKKGGRFRRKTDFAKSYVVEDSVYRRLEKYIDIPPLDINKADSTAFETLPGIGKFFAAAMVRYREELGGYSFAEQLMDIWRFDREKFDGLQDLITVGSTDGFALWTLPEAELAAHPYIGKRAAHGIVIFRENSPQSDWTVANLLKAGILDPEKGRKLEKCRIVSP